ncbi:MAG: ribonuclease R [Lachnospiraceae bacterium]|nr:ribonuclease R [Lachnospiraceae bacterium]
MAKNQKGPERGSIITGVFNGTGKEYGFVSYDGGEDIFISRTYRGGALNRDRVKVRIISAQVGKKPEGAILEILEHANSVITGTLEMSSGFGFVLADDRKLGSDIFVSAENLGGAKDGDKVVCELFVFDPKKCPEGKITEVLGASGTLETDIMSVIRSNNIPEVFPDDVLAAAGRIAQSVSEQEMKGRTDLRSLLTFTIDGKDAKDMDDALSIESEGDNTVLYVHIADVSHYVRENSVIDREARDRGTSVYFADRVIPMLPVSLSNGICSLNPDEDRLAFTCRMVFDSQGNRLDAALMETVIRSDKKMDYPSVGAILEEKTDDPEYESILKDHEPFIDDLKKMHELSLKLRKKRYDRGAVDFDLPEAKAVIDDEGVCTDIVPYDRNEAARLIEDFMLAANESVAEYASWCELPFIYRNHESPSEDKMTIFASFAGGLGHVLHVRNGSIHPKELSKLLESVRGTDEDGLIGRMLLRSMKKADYGPENEGHFGLAARFYTHFTSPIRRYPDLMIHRILKENLNEGLDKKRSEHYREMLPEVCERSSYTERRADSVERDILKIKMAEYMSAHVGDTYTAVISGVSGYGLYAQLDNTIEGFINCMDIGKENYIYDETKLTLTGERSHRTFRLGQRISVQVTGASMYPAAVDFRLYEQEAEKEE